MMFEDHWHFWGMHGFWWIFWVILILIVIGMSIRNRGRTRSDFTEKSPEDILKERYAKGEISEEEYKRMKKEL